MRTFESENFQITSKETATAKITCSNPEKKIDYSIIIPTYQEEKILDRVLGMYTKELRGRYNFELIVSDGGSTDRTCEIAEKHADKVIRHKEDRRQTIGEGRNRGADVAEGDILIFINADTYPADFPSFLNAIENFKIHSDKEIALACRCRGIPEEEKFIDKVFYSIHNPIIKFGTKLGLGYGRGECQVIKKKSFEAVGGYDEKVHAGEDFDLYGRLIKHGNIRYDSDLFVYESTRRFRKFGYMRVLSLWAMNALAVKLKGKSMSEDWEAVR